MQLDLLAEETQSPLPLYCEVFHHFLESKDMSSQSAFEVLRDEIAWETHFIKISGKDTPCPRKAYWMGEQVYSYSGTMFKPHPWHPLVFEIKEMIEQQVGTQFNSVLMNYYRDGNDHIGFHRDDEVELGETPFIASMSLGGTRDFVVKSKDAKWIIPLENDSLFLMKDHFQKEYQHSIPKRTRMILPRINLTYRYISPNQ